MNNYAQARTQRHQNPEKSNTLPALRHFVQCLPPQPQPPHTLIRAPPRLPPKQTDYLLRLRLLHLLASGLLYPHPAMVTYALASKPTPTLTACSAAFCLTRLLLPLSGAPRLRGRLPLALPSLGEPPSPARPPELLRRTCSYSSLPAGRVGR